jgi:hypothetical protein
MSDLHLRIQARTGATFEIVRNVPKPPDYVPEAKWYPECSAKIIEEIGRSGTWVKPRWFIPATSIDLIEFVSGPIPPALK